MLPMVGRCIDYKEGVDYDTGIESLQGWFCARETGRLIHFAPSIIRGGGMMVRGP
jgi:hypothetical protein